MKDCKRIYRASFYFSDAWTMTEKLDAICEYLKTLDLNLDVIIDEKIVKNIDEALEKILNEDEYINRIVSKVVEAITDELIELYEYVFKLIQDYKASNDYYKDLEIKNIPCQLNKQQYILKYFTVSEGTTQQRLEKPLAYTFVKERNEWFAVKQNTLNKVTFYRYNSNFVLLETKELNKNITCNGLVYGFNTSCAGCENGKLTFYVNLNEEDMLQYNYDDNTTSVVYTVYGGSYYGCDADKKYLVNTFGSKERVEGVYIYDYLSVCAMRPKLLRTIRFGEDVIHGEQIKGITMINNLMYLSCADLTNGKPVIKTVALTGETVNNYDFDKVKLFEIINSDVSGRFDLNSNFINYGISFIEDEANVIVPITFYSIADLNALTFPYKLGRFDYKHNVPEKINKNYNQQMTFKPVTNWINGKQYPKRPKDPERTAMFTKDASGVVRLRGAVTYENPNKTPNPIDPILGGWVNVRLFNLPKLYRPHHYYEFFTTNSQIVRQVGPQDNNITATSARVAVHINGDVEVTYTDSVSHTPYVPIDMIQFYSENVGWEVEDEQ